MKKIKYEDVNLEIKNKQEDIHLSAKRKGQTTHLFVRSFSDIENFAPEWEDSVSVSTNNT